MEQERVILKRIREKKSLSISAASKLVGKSKGWLSEVENGKGRAVLKQSEYQRIYALYEGDKYKTSFGTWIRHEEGSKLKDVTDPAKSGAALKFIRTHKAKLNARSAAIGIGISPGYLSKIESGKKSISIELRNKILSHYGYKPSSFRNFTTKDKRSKSVPVKYRLQNLIGLLSDLEAEQVLISAIELIRNRNQE